MKTNKETSSQIKLSKSQRQRLVSLTIKQALAKMKKKAK